MSKKMSSPSSDASSSTARGGGRRVKLGLDGTVLRDHDIAASCKVAGPRSSRCGQEFLGCPLWKTSDCGFFMWKEDLNEVFRMKEEEMSIGKLKEEIEKLKGENLKLADKLAKVQGKKKQLEEEARGLKMMICDAKSEKSNVKVVFEDHQRLKG